MVPAKEVRREVKGAEGRHGEVDAAQRLRKNIWSNRELARKARVTQRQHNGNGVEACESTKEHLEL
jgi:hypothetical protein